MNVYDFDGTIYRGDSSIDFFVYCLKHYPKTILGMPKFAVCCILYKMRRISKKELKDKIEDIIDFSELKEFIDIPLKNYSSGMYARLGFSIATIYEPEILIIDEVLSVGDFHFQEKSLNKIMEMIEKGTTVLFVSHDIEQVEKLCKKAIWLEKGKVKVIGDAKKICKEYSKS